MVADESIMMVGVMGLAGWLMWLILRRFQILTAVRQQRYATLKGLIEKYGTAKELDDLLQSEAGKKLFEDPSSGNLNPAAAAIRFLQMGVIAGVAGGAMLINAARLNNESDINYIREALRQNYWGTLLLAIGISLFVVSAISYWAGKRYRANLDVKPAVGRTNRVTD